MRRFIFASMLIMAFAVLSSASFANVFAAHLSGPEIPWDYFDPPMTLSYRLNAGITTGTVTVEIFGPLPSTTVVRTLNGGKNYGLNQVTWDGRHDLGYYVPIGCYKFRVITDDHVGHPTWTNITPLNPYPPPTLIPSCYYYAPRGVECVRDQNSRNFGRVLVSLGHSTVSTVTGAADHDSQGVYLLYNDLTHDGGTTASAYATGNSLANWNPAEYDDPYRIHFADFSDGNLYVARGYYSTAGIDEVVSESDDDFSAAGYHEPLSDIASLYHGNQLGANCFGTGASRVLYGTDEDFDLSTSPSSWKEVFKWPIGTTLDDWDVSTPTLFCHSIGSWNPTGYTLYHLRDLDIMSSGAVVVTNYRWSEGPDIPYIICLRPDGSGAWYLTESQINSRHLVTGITCDELINNVIYAACGYGWVSILDLNGNWLGEFDSMPSGTYLQGIATDAAGNVLVTSSSAEELRMWSPPDGPNQYTTTYHGAIGVYVWCGVEDWEAF